MKYKIVLGILLLTGMLSLCSCNKVKVFNDKSTVETTNVLTDKTLKDKFSNKVENEDKQEQVPNVSQEEPKEIEYTIEDFNDVDKTGQVRKSTTKNDLLETPEDFITYRNSLKDNDVKKFLFNFKDSQIAEMSTTDDEVSITNFTFKNSTTGELQRENNRVTKYSIEYHEPQGYIDESGYEVYLSYSCNVNSKGEVSNGKILIGKENSKINEINSNIKLSSINLSSYSSRQIKDCIIRVLDSKKLEDSIKLLKGEY